MSKRALVIGIDSYDNVSSLGGCVNDAAQVAEALSKNEDGSLNFSTRLYTAPNTPGHEHPPITSSFVERESRRLFTGEPNDEVIFYFSGHGVASDYGGAFVTTEGTPEAPGFDMYKLLLLAQKSPCRSIVLIADCCYSGQLGNDPATNLSELAPHRSQLREGITVLSASRPTEVSMELEGQGVFTGLLLGGLLGAAADLRGCVSAGSLYSFVENALGAWDQRPLLKMNVKDTGILRRCKPRFTDDDLRSLPNFFSSKLSKIQLDPSYEQSQASAKPENVNMVRYLKRAQLAGLIEAEPAHTDLYWTAMRSEHVKLTLLGHYYWYLAQRGLIGG